MPAEARTRSEILQPEDCKIPLDKIEAIAADPRLQQEYEGEYGRRLYPLILFCLTNESYDEDHARLLWDSVNEHMDYLARTLGKNPGIAFATLDYFANWLSGPRAGDDYPEAAESRPITHARECS